MLGPLGPRLPGEVDRRHGEGPVAPVQEEDSLPLDARLLELQERGPTARPVLELLEDPLDERVPRGEEVELLAQDRLFAVEGPEEAGPARHAGKVLEERVSAELEVPGPNALLLGDVEAEELAGGDDEPLHRGVEARGDAGEDSGREVGPEALGVEVVVGRPLADLRGAPDLRDELGHGQRPTRPRAEAFSAFRIAASTFASDRSRPPSGSRKRPIRS